MSSAVPVSRYDLGAISVADAFGAVRARPFIDHAGAYFIDIDRSKLLSTEITAIPVS